MLRKANWLLVALLAKAALAHERGDRAAAGKFLQAASNSGGSSNLVTRGFMAQMAIEASPDGKWATRYFSGTCYHNGNIHLRFLRPDLLAAFNKRAGGRALRPGEQEAA